MSREHGWEEAVSLFPHMGMGRGEFPVRVSIYPGRCTALSITSTLFFIFPFINACSVDDF